MGRQPGLSIKVKDKIHPSTGHESLGRGEVGGHCHAPPALPPGKRHSTHLHESRWAPGPVWTGADNLAPTGVRSPDLQTRGESHVFKNLHNHKELIKPQNVCYL